MQVTESLSRCRVMKISQWLNTDKRRGREDKIATSPRLFVKGAGQTRRLEKTIWRGRSEPRSHHAVRLLRPTSVCS